VAVEYLGNRKLKVAFSDGHKGTFDMAPMIESSRPYARLASERLLAKAEVRFGTVCWGDDLDIAPEVLYEGTA